MSKLNIFVEYFNEVTVDCKHVTVSVTFEQEILDCFYPLVTYVSDMYLK